MLQPIGADLGDAGYDHAGVGVADEDHIVQRLELQQLRDVADVEVQVDLGRLQQFSEMGPVAQSAERGRVHGCTRLSQQRRDLAPAPAAVPGPVHQYECGHQCPPCY